MKKSLGVGNLAEEVDYSRPWSHRLVTKPTFEAVVASVIMTNVLIMAAQIQYQGLQVGYMLEYRWYEEEAQDVWGGATVVFDILDYLFGTIYVVELLLKIHAFRRDWVRDLWNWFDAIIVAFWLVEKPLQDVLVLPADATLLRTARLFKLLRLVKVIKTLHGFDSLYLLVTTLKGSLQILGWSCVLLFMVQMLIAFVVFFILEEAYFHNPTYPIEERRRVFEYFGSFSRAMLSMFEMSLANWPPVCRLLVESVNEWFMLFFVAHKLTIGFAVIGVINGVFMQETFKAASSDDSIMMRQKEREIKMYTEKMSRLFFAADESGHGHIDIEAFQRIMGDREIVTWLASMEIPVRDPESLFELLDSSKAGYLTADSMAKGALKLRGGAKSVDVLALKRQLHDIEEMLAEVARGKSLKRQPTHASEKSSRWQWQSSIRDADS
jgi:voltage-gated sodium channel